MRSASRSAAATLSGIPKAETPGVPACSGTISGYAANGLSGRAGFSLTMNWRTMSYEFLSSDWCRAGPTALTGVGCRSGVPASGDATAATGSVTAAGDATAAVTAAPPAEAAPGCHHGLTPKSSYSAGTAVRAIGAAGCCGAYVASGATELLPAADEPSEEAQRASCIGSALLPSSSSSSAPRIAQRTGAVAYSSTRPKMLPRRESVADGRSYGVLARERDGVAFGIETLRARLRYLRVNCVRDEGLYNYVTV